MAHTGNSPTKPSDHSINLVQINMPPFHSLEVDIWFPLLELEFSTHRVTSDTIKFGHLTSRLPHNLLRSIKHILIDPASKNKYEAAKQTILKEVCLSDKDRLEQLFKQVKLENKKPSTLLREIRDLADSRLDDSVIKELWFQRLPPQVAALTEIKSECPLETIAEVADGMYARLG